MNDLLMSCSEALTQAATPSCVTDFGERIVTLMFSKTEVTAVSDVPTSIEFTTAYDAGTLCTIRGLSNTHRTFTSETEIEIIHKEWFDKTYRVSGKIRTLNAAIARMTEKLNYYDELYFYYLTDTDYCFGPYIATTTFSLIKSDGKGVPSYISFMIDYFGTGSDNSNHDPYYDDLSSYYLLKEDGFNLLTEAGDNLLI